MHNLVANCQPNRLILHQRITETSKKNIRIDSFFLQKNPGTLYSHTEPRMPSAQPPVCNDNHMIEVDIVVSKLEYT